jgi:predicted aconitase with swiveling domain
MEFKAKIIQPWEDEIIGELLITKSKISFLGDVDMNTGIVVGTDLDIKGQSLSGKIFIFYEGRGSTVGSNILYGLARNRLAPKLIGTCHAEAITISGAIFGSIPMISSLSEDVFKELKSGDILRLRINDGYAIMENMGRS